GEFFERFIKISHRTIGSINQEREEFIDKCITTLHNNLFDLRKEDSCSFACSSMLLGALIKQMDSWKFSSPRPVAPFLGHSISSVAESIHKVSTPTWYPACTCERYSKCHCGQ